MFEIYRRFEGTMPFLPVQVHAMLVEMQKRQEEEMQLLRFKQAKDQKQQPEALMSELDRMLAELKAMTANREATMSKFLSQASIPPRPPFPPPDPPDMCRFEQGLTDGIVFDKDNTVWLLNGVVTQRSKIELEVESIETGSSIQQIESCGVKDVLSTNITLSNGSNPEEESRPKETSTHKADSNFGEETITSNASKSSQVPSQESLYHLPVFDGTLLDCWIVELDRFFELKQYGNEEKFDLISLSLEGAALKWFRRHKREFTDWTDIKRKLMARFGLVNEAIREIGLIQEHESPKLTDAILEVDCVHSQEFSSQFQVPIPSLEPSRRRHKESLVVIYDLSCDLGCVIGKTIGSICDSELGQDNSLDEEEFKGFKLGKLSKNERRLSAVCLLEKKEVTKTISAWNNHVWEPGGVLIERDKWKWSGKCHERSIVVRLMQGLVCDKEKKRLRNVTAAGCICDLDQVNSLDKEEFMGFTEFSKPQLAMEFLLLNFGLFMNTRLLHDKIDSVFVALALLVVSEHNKAIRTCYKKAVKVDKHKINFTVAVIDEHEDIESACVLSAHTLSHLVKDNDDGRRNTWIKLTLYSVSQQTTSSTPQSNEVQRETNWNDVTQTEAAWGAKHTSLGYVENSLAEFCAYEVYHPPRPPELSRCKEDEESTATESVSANVGDNEAKAQKFSSLRTRMFSSRGYCDRISPKPYLNSIYLN